jgi:predicted TIM-barrel fold metal-dependent hydrolase
VIERARDLGVKVICGHKGLPLLEFDRSHNGPEDLVACSKLFPDVQFVIYHSAYEVQTAEGPYDPNRAGVGVNSLIKALDDYDVPPNANVWAELGTTWRETMSSPTEAAHVLGKLLSRVGEDRVLWGTDGIWYGSPQPQIMAFRAFQITEEAQERFGYPALTPAIKAKVFGLNAARLFGVDPEAQRCAIDQDALGTARAEVEGLAAAGAVARWQERGPVTRRDLLTWLARPETNWSPL